MMDNLENNLAECYDHKNKYENIIDEEGNELIYIKNYNIDINDGDNINKVLMSEDVSEDIKEEILNKYEANIKESNDDELIEKSFSNINELKENLLMEESEISKYDEETLSEENKNKILKFYKLINNLNKIINNININEKNQYNLEEFNVNNKVILHTLKINDRDIVNTLIDIYPSIYMNYDKFSDAISLLILSAGKEDGSLAKELDENGNLVPISIEILVNGEEKLVSIKEIIPIFKNLEGEELEKKFSFLHELASVYYSEHFESYFDEKEKYAIFKEHSMDTIKKSNTLSHVVKAYNIGEDGNIEKIDLSPDEINLHLSNTNNNNIDEKFLKFISEIDENDLSNIDINNHEKLLSTFKDYWDDTGMDKEMDSLYKAMAIHCVKNTKCKQYVKENKGKLSFNIASYKTDNKGKETDNHTLIFNNDDSEETIHAFTFKENNGKYEIDENQDYSTSSYKLSSFNIFNKPSIISIDDKKYVMKPGIGLLAECKYEFKDSKRNSIN